MRQKRFQKIAVSVTVVLSFAICGFLYSCQDSGSTVVAKEEGLEDTLPESSAETISSVSLRTSEASFVYVCGNVLHAGVYEVPADSRIFQVIEMAGGPTPEGYVEALNLAEHVYDGQKLYVPTYEEYEKGGWEENAGVSGSGAKQGTEESLVNINTADTALLMSLPGIGQSRAQAIIEYRSGHAFDCIEDIMNVDGIKAGAFDKIKDLICVR